ncbi:MAG TPA: hypothetical protein DGL25_02035 [Dehalococcoidia bacterium]|nr:hypothetical protein [Dehalococcoidia bacterium]|tara:strand:- start:10639 stop:12429 length:1791 start_codon:yes stop_codon:yes gene_type:complete
MVRALGALAVVTALALVIFSGRDDGAQAQECIGLEPFEFDTHEVFDNAGLYLAATELAAAGEAITFSTTPSGEAHGLEYPGLLKGSRVERLNQDPDTSIRIPPTLLKSILWVESKFAQAHRDVPWGGVGPVQRSFDCGFGLGQITTGMENYDGSPSAQQALIGTHFLFNVAATARVLAEKWNADFLPIAGKGDPASLEDWYYAIWAYNGLFYSNHPQHETNHAATWLNWPGYSPHPYLDPFRGDVWHCNDMSAPTWISAGDGVLPWFDYGDYTYIERVYGCMRHPPMYPVNLYQHPEFAPTPWPERTPEPEPTETPTAATSEGESEQAETQETAATEVPATPEPPPMGEPWPAPGADGIPRLWPPIQVNMPDLSIPAVAAALSPQVYIACSDSFWFDGCPLMHFPTSFPDLGIEPHLDLTPRVSPSLLDQLIGSPKTLITGPGDVSIAIENDGNPGSVEVLIQNIGTWLAPFRIKTSDPWILVRREGNGRLHGGITIGAETTVMLCTRAYCGEDITKRGHDTALIITLDLEELPVGEDVQGEILIEPLLGEGSIKRIVVHAGPSVEKTTTAAGSNDAELNQALGNRIVLPGLARDD